MEEQPKKLRVAMVVGTFPVLSETFVLNQINWLLDHGYHVDIYPFNKSSEKQLHPDLIKYDLMQNTTYIVRAPQNKIKAVLKFIGVLARLLVLFPKETLKLLNVRKYGKKVFDNVFKARYFLGKKYDVIHCHFGPMGRQLAFLKDILPQVKLITQFHGYDVSSYVLKNGENAYDELFAKGDCFLPVSDYFKNKLESWHCPSDKTRILYCGVYLNQFQYRENPFQFDQKVNLLYLGRLVEKKGVEYVIEAVARLNVRFPQLRCLIVGDGDRRQGLEEQVKRLSLEKMIEFAGSVDSVQARKYFEQADLFVSPSITSERGDEEGLVVTIKEAMATGVPVISTNHASIPEMIVDGFNGFLVPEKDFSSIAEKISYLIYNPELCRNFAQRSRRLMEEKFDQRILNEELEEIYHEVCEK